ncbi:hypothetical protein QH494_27780 [Sphingomonas sp. AR_OL41]|uniref:hypothetical protein n=1 Tax=Sphingomonas sp. AR_OL41 TaxID=3042729 RepID=UPI0024806CB1|nr:hypothetical protein [Sphingomonas sp. AR_OL41]MDH7975995.1 hypothetical protein [Sphingomonas sp. AR_OL41]
MPGRLTGITAAIAIVATPTAASANNYGESLAWQFRTSSDRANQAAVLDLIARRRGGYYAAPIYNTTIARQVNCTVAASATGNNDGQSAVANAPSVSGATSTASGNANTTTLDSAAPGAHAGNAQGNSGAVTAGVIGDTTSSVQGVAWQALNTNQTNNGRQQATVQDSTACAFAARN